MKEYKNVQSTLYPEHLVYGVSSVDINSNIREVSENNTTMFIYDTLRYSIDEYENLLDTKKERLIAKTKEALKEYLQNNPIEYEGEFYTITQDKQTQLFNMLDMYKRVSEISKDEKTSFKLTWNSTGKVSKEWEYAELTKLATIIFAHVKNLVTEQQCLEEYIKSCITENQLNDIVIDYDECPYSTQYFSEQSVELEEKEP